VNQFTGSVDTIRRSHLRGIVRPEWHTSAHIDNLPVQVPQAPVGLGTPFFSRPKASPWHPINTLSARSLLGRESVCFNQRPDGKIEDFSIQLVAGSVRLSTVFSRASRIAPSVSTCSPWWPSLTGCGRLAGRWAR